MPIDHTRAFFKDHDGLIYEYPSGHWYKIECQEVPETPERPAGLKYSLTFFNSDNECLVRFDNSHAVNIRGRPNPIAHDHWHRFGEPQQLVPYEFMNAEQLISDFFDAIDRHLPADDLTRETHHERPP
jgi:hypothetical protein